MNARGAVAALALVAVLGAACNSAGNAPATVLATPESPTPTAAATTGPAPTATATPSATPALVGQWEFHRTCQAIVSALTNAGHPELIRQDVGELIAGNVDGTVPADWDPKDPCAGALPPTSHSHTFWPNGRFNSYDENGNEVDDGSWKFIDDHTFTIGTSTFTYVISGGSNLMFEPVVPDPCTGMCADSLWWVYAVSYPGSTWTRVTSGPHVPWVVGVNRQRTGVVAPTWQASSRRRSHWNSSVQP